MRDSCQKTLRHVKFLWGAVFCLLFLGFQDLSAVKLDVSVQAASAVLMNADTGAILFEKNPRQSLDPASITKIATAIYTLHVRGERLDKRIVAERDSVASISVEERRRSNYTLPAYWLEPGTAHIGIKTGEDLSLQDLLYGMMLASGGDAANVIAQYIGGSIPVFMDLLNDYLREIGCHDTTFKNPHGLYHPNHQTTAYDMAILTREALKNPAFCEIVKTVRYTRPQTNKQGPTTLIQTNRLLKKGKLYYPKAIGVKTGYISAAQNTLVAAAQSQGRTLIVVLLKCGDRETIFRDAIKLFETAFREQPLRRTLLPKGPQKVVLALEGASKSIPTCLAEEAAIAFYPSEEPTVKCQLAWDAITLPVVKGAQVGVLTFEDESGRALLTQPLLAGDDVGYSWYYCLRQFFHSSTFRAVVGVLLALLLFGSLLLMLRR